MQCCRTTGLTDIFKYKYIFKYISIYYYNTTYDRCYSSKFTDYSALHGTLTISIAMLYVAAMGNDQKQQR